MTDERLIAVKMRAAAEFRKIPGVTGVGLGGRERDGRPTGELVIKVFVRQNAQAVLRNACITLLLGNALRKPARPSHLTLASIVIFARLIVALLGPEIRPVAPSNSAAASAPHRPGCPNVTPPLLVRSLPFPDASAAVTLPMGSPRRQ